MVVMVLCLAILQVVILCMVIPIYQNTKPSKFEQFQVREREDHNRRLNEWARQQEQIRGGK